MRAFATPSPMPPSGGGHAEPPVLATTPSPPVLRSPSPLFIPVLNLSALHAAAAGHAAAAAPPSGRPASADQALSSRRQSTVEPPAAAAAAPYPPGSRPRAPTSHNSRPLPSPSGSAPPLGPLDSLEHELKLDAQAEAAAAAAAAAATVSVHDGGACPDGAVVRSAFSTGRDRASSDNHGSGSGSHGTLLLAHESDSASDLYGAIGGAASAPASDRAPGQNKLVAARQQRLSDPSPLPVSPPRSPRSTLSLGSRASLDDSDHADGEKAGGPLGAAPAHGRSSDGGGSPTSGVVGKAEGKVAPEAEKGEAGGKAAEDEDDEEEEHHETKAHGHGRKRMSAEAQFRKRQALRNGAVAIEGTGLSFWLFDEDYPPRVWTYDLVTNKYFDYALFIIIALNCCCMAMEGPMWGPDNIMTHLLYWSDVLFTVLFGLEALVKMFAFTFRAYIREVTNQVDFSIVVVSVLVLALEAILQDASAIKGLRALRAIKPLRMLTRSAGMRIVFKSIAMSLAAMGNVSIVLLIFFLIFAILGTQLFMGLLHSCNDTTVPNKDACVGYYLDSLSGTNITRQWTNPWPNFDNVGNSLLVCFLVATLNGYTGIMVETMNAPLSPDDQPGWMTNEGAFFFYVGFVFLVAFALLNLYIGVIFSQFTKIRLAGQGSAFITSEQQEWAELINIVFKLRPEDKAHQPRGWIRSACFFLATSSVYESFIMATILMNLAVLAAASYGQSEARVLLYDQLNILFCCVYISEALVKITGLGWRMYWKDNWNRFDFAMVLLAIVDLAVSSLHVSFLRALRVLRAQKLLRLLRNSSIPQVAHAAQNVKSLASVLLAAIPGVGNVLALIGLVVYMYSYVGVIMFSNLVWDSGINEHVNFNNFGNALILLIRVATLDNWWDILSGTVATPDNSNCSKDLGNCGNYYIALPYFITYIIIVTIILLNLFTAVIIETFEKTHSQEDWKLSPQALDTFVHLWSLRDDGSGSITPKDLEELLMELDPPLGLGPDVNSKDVLRFVYDLDIPLINGRVPFHKTAFELVKRVFQSKVPEGAVKEQLDKLMMLFFQNLHEEEGLNFSTAVVVGRVQTRWRARVRAAKLHRRKLWRGGRLLDDSEFPLTLTSLHEEWDNIRQAYQSYQKAAKEVWEEIGCQGPNPEHQWRFSSTLHPRAGEMEADAWKGARTLFKAMQLLRKVKVVPLALGGGGGGEDAAAAGGAAAARRVSLPAGGVAKKMQQQHSGRWDALPGRGEGPAAAAGSGLDGLWGDASLRPAGSKAVALAAGVEADRPRPAWINRASVEGRLEEVLLRRYSRSGLSSSGTPSKLT